MTSDAATPLDRVERGRLLDAWVDVRRRIAQLEAQAAALLSERIGEHDAEVAEHPYHRDAIYRSMIAEYSAAGRLSRGSVEFAFADALALQAMPTLTAAFGAGRVTAAHVREMVRAASVVREAVRNGRVDAAVLGLYETAVLVVAEADSPARTRAHARQVAAALAGETLLERHRRAASERSVSVRSLDDGLALLTAVLPETLAVAIQDRITRMAREVIRARGDAPSPMFLDGEDPEDVILPEHIDPEDPLAGVIFGEDSTFTTDPLAGDPLASPAAPESIGVAGNTVADDERTIDQVRADLFSDLLLAASPSPALGNDLAGIQARIQVTIAATTLAGIDDQPAELDGYGPLDPTIARTLAGRNNGWSRLFLDPGGMVTETDTYTPTEGMRRHLRARDQHCRFPGCRMPVHRCEIDHNHDHAKGGRTRIDNLAHFCTSHHQLKHPDIDPDHRWTARSRPDGTIEWTSPLGRIHSDRAPRRVMFV
ncbi:HNH endonuclease [Microbacterium sp. NPDC090225]|uniref:HNH endonuclease signature motif containing protein n=1 Tax=Microbacterium sp. NPDC090225 TaxID=3364207 RepID=UPI0037FB1BF7